VAWSRGGFREVSDFSRTREGAHAEFGFAASLAPRDEARRRSTCCERIPEPQTIRRHVPILLDRWDDENRFRAIRRLGQTSQMTRYRQEALALQRSSLSGGSSGPANSPNTRNAGRQIPAQAFPIGKRVNDNPSIS